MALYLSVSRENESEETLRHMQEKVTVKEILLGDNAKINKTHRRRPEEST